MRTAELTGALLDYWVSKAEGATIDGNTVRIGATVHFGMQEPPSFCTNWNMSGPIIERERIVTFPGGVYQWAAFIQQNPHCSYVDTTVFDEITGPTPLVAAMRAYVASKFGDEVPEAAPHDTLKGENKA